MKSAGLLLSLVACSALAQPAEPRPAGLVEDLVAANRILAEHGVLDGWGHVSVRLGRGLNRLGIGEDGRTRLYAALEALQ